jgi:hypothetical protein
MSALREMCHCFVMVLVRYLYGHLDDILCQTVTSLHTNIDSSSWINSSSVFHLSLDCPDYI